MSETGDAGWEARMERLSELGRRLKLLEAYVAVIEERKDRAERIGRGENPGRRLRVVRDGDQLSDTPPPTGPEGGCGGGCDLLRDNGGGEESLEHHDYLVWVLTTGGLEGWDWLLEELHSAGEFYGPALYPHQLREVAAQHTFPKPEHVERVTGHLCRTFRKVRG